MVRPEAVDAREVWAAAGVGSGDEAEVRRARTCSINAEGRKRPHRLSTVTFSQDRA